MGEDRDNTPDQQVRRLFGEAEKGTAQAVEELVHSNSFGEILARVTGNVMGITKIGFDVLDLTVRNLRLAGRPDLIRLGKQLARNEDKLERVLQEVEQLRSEVDKRDSSRASTARAKPARRNSSSSTSNGSTRKRSTSAKSSNGRSAPTKSRSG
jgi:peptidoglycan hydrolase CwlO-like protein